MELIEQRAWTRTNVSHAVSSYIISFKNQNNFSCKLSRQDFFKQQLVNGTNLGLWDSTSICQRRHLFLWGSNFYHMENLSKNSGKQFMQHIS